MARAAKLKVYRTAIGFHDAYVAAASQKAALEAWGSDHNLFARGVAELVEDPDLMREPLEHPGAVVRRLRGTTAEQIAALGPGRPGRETAAPSTARAGPPDETAAKRRAKAAPRPRAAPRPSRAALDKAQAALEAVEARHQRDLDALAKREADLGRERRATEQAHDAELAKVKRTADRAEAVYDRAMRKWRG
ncbi:hypothetical protein EAH87_12090 [Sphingomonas koreensis]|nr:hypothetical protein EAH87_12090 [Sphingomonas koreensis]